MKIERTGTGRWVVEAGALGLRADGATIGEAMTVFRELCKARRPVPRMDSPTPDSYADALAAAEDLAEDIVFGEMADKAVSEPGESVPWEAVREELDI